MYDLCILCSKEYALYTFVTSITSTKSLKFYLCSIMVLCSVYRRNFNNSMTMQNLYLLGKLLVKRSLNLVSVSTYADKECENKIL